MTGTKDSIEKIILFILGVFGITPRKGGISIFEAEGY